MPDTSAERPIPFRSPGGLDLSGLDVLVIENDTDNRDVFSVFLHSCGANVMTAETADAALEWVGRRHIDAIITDVSVLRRSGICESLSRIRGMPQYKDTPIIAVTGWAQKHLPEAAEFTAFIQKPVDLDKLAMTIRQLVEPA